MHVAITGGSGGIGKALAEAYAAPGVRLSLAGRDGGRLESCAIACQQLGAETRTAVFDIRDREALRAWLDGADAWTPLDAVFANAGVSATSYPDRLEHEDDTARLFEINTMAAVWTAGRAAELMLPRGKGCIVIMSSTAALHPMPYSPAYSASKEAARVYGFCLRSWLRKKGIGVTVVCPGYVDTPMSDRLISDKPLLWSPEKAAGYIKRKLARNPRQIVFPRLLHLGIWLESLLPEILREYFAGKFAFRVRPDRDSPLK